MSVRRAQDERIEGTPDGFTAISEIMDVPDAPTIGAATNVGTSRAYNNGSATVAFTAPATGGTPTSYTATSTPGSFTGTGASSPLTVTGLSSATSYTFAVTGTNSNGTSPTSSSSSSITATTVPQAPTIGTATDLGTGTTASVTFTAGATGGSAITSYTVTSSPGSITATGTSPVTVSGLTGGTAYTFTVTATNANGTSAASGASNSITPVVPTSFEFIALASPAGSSSFTWSSIPQTYKHLQIRYANSYDSGGASVVGQALIKFNGDTGLYSFQDTGISGSTSQSRGYGINTYTNGAYVDCPGDGWGSYFASGYVDIHNYSSTDKYKTWRGHVSNIVASGSGSNSSYVRGSAYKSTSAISSITITQNQGGNWRTGTSFALYGIKG